MSELLKLEISALATDGRGVARDSDGRVVMVENALTGERVAANIIRVRKGYAEAACLDILAPSSQRVEPPCPYYGLCGGCDLQHLSYDGQQQAKRQWLERALRNLELPPLETVASAALGYRHRLRLHFGAGGAGFYAKGSRALVPVERCLLAADYANERWPEISAIDMPRLQEVEVLAGDNQLALQMLGHNLKPRQLAIEAIINWPGHMPDLESGITYYQENGLRMQAYPGLFSQINWEVNRQLIKYLQEMLKPYLSKGPLLDLFAGSGNLSLPLAKMGAEVWAVEGVSGAVRAGRHLAESNNLPCRFVHQPVEQFLNHCPITPQTVVLDPPRSGAKGMVSAIIGLKPAAIAYVSCHPAALARDANEITQNGYALSRLLMLDMFPQTSQVEALALFTLAE